MLEAVRGFGSGLFSKDSSPEHTFVRQMESSLVFMRPGGRERMEAFLDSGCVVALFYIEVENFQVFMDIYGGMLAGRIQSVLEEEVRLLADELLGTCKLRYIDRLEPGKFLILCGDDQWQEEQLGDLVLTFRLKLKSRVKQESLNVTGQGLNVLTGYGLIQKDGARLEDSVYRALSDARRVAAGTLDVAKLSLLREFREIVINRQLRSVFQPIVELDTGNISAWEALTRGPEGSHFSSPAVLFDFAEEVEQVFPLEKTCREGAIHRLGTLGQEQKLFLNINPRTLVDPDFSPGQTLQLLEKVGLKASDVVLEITERHSIRDFDLFHRTLEHYRNQGFGVAIDDVGTGYSGLWSIAQIRPEFLKVDMSLVRDIDTDPVKRALMETMVTFSENIGCRLIAEGIETEGELSALMRMGVHYGQGFFLARPAYPKPGLSQEVQNQFSKSGRGMVGERRIASPLRELVETVPLVTPETTVSEVKDLLKGSGLMGAAVVVNGRRPVGLVMRHHLDSALSSQYGLSLYLNRPVSLIMDPSPLYAENGTPVENVAREAMKRKKATIFDHVVVTERGTLQGVVSVQRMMDTIATAQVEMAKGANPLTGLPGNVVIELELERRCNSGEAFAIIYADLDNFKVYNDTYGFKNGDKVIQLISTVTQWATRRHGDSSRDFVGHIGGDDLVAMCGSHRAERISKAITRCFGRLVKGCYMPADRERGWIETKGRDGVMQKFPLVSVSLAIVDCQGLCDLNVLGHRAAQMKKYAKSITGNSYARDRRGPMSGMDSETDPEYCTIAIGASGHAGAVVRESPHTRVVEAPGDALLTG
ncbi:MAG: EAL and GGDEF domain-containing protein [Proteobacteria bacterium]|nr:EAL and GGDEF domain-containing protein [Pseudomonadota bacterium]